MSKIHEYKGHTLSRGHYHTAVPYSNRWYIAGPDGFKDYRRGYATLADAKARIDENLANEEAMLYRYFCSACRRMFLSATLPTECPLCGSRQGGGTKAA